MQDSISPRPPVIIIGAHRSGTTATTRALRLLGLQLGERLDSHDEPREMQKLHETFLRELGAAWYNPAPFLAFLTGAEGKPSCAKYLRDRVKPDLSIFGYGKTVKGWRLRRRLPRGVAWGWKEPRTTLFATCWLRVFPEARFLHIVRNPLAVASSIQRRELEFQAKGDAPSGRVGDFNYCVDLAMTYVEAGEAVAVQTPHFYRVRFEDIQADPVKELTKIASFCDLNYTERQMRRAAATIRPVAIDELSKIEENSGLLTRYPVAAKIGYGSNSA
jgi:sulfotransferase family protein